MAHRSKDGVKYKNVLVNKRETNSNLSTELIESNLAPEAIEYLSHSNKMRKAIAETKLKEKMTGQDEQSAKELPVSFLHCPRGLPLLLHCINAHAFT